MPRLRLLYIKFTSYLKIQRTRSIPFISGFSLIFASKPMYNTYFVVANGPQEVA